MSVCENMDWNEELASYIMRTLNCQFNCLHHMFDVLQLIIFSLIYFLILSFFLFSTFSNPIKFQIIANKITIPLSQSLSGLFIKINAKRPQKYHIKKHKTLVVCLKKIVRPTGQNLKYYNFKWYKRENKCTQNNHRHMFSRSILVVVTVQRCGEETAQCPEVWRGSAPVEEYNIWIYKSSQVVESTGKFKEHPELHSTV